jgi:hypothetical protein
MNRTIKAVTGACFVVALAGLLLAAHGFARSSEIEGSTQADAGLKQEASDTHVRPEGPGDKAVPTDAQNASVFEGRKERLSYALGMVLGSQFRDRSVDVDLDFYVRGLKDALSGHKTLLTHTEARAAVNLLQSELKRKRTAPQAAATALTDIRVSFKLDPRVTRGVYMGDRWISPPTYIRVGLPDAKELTVEARAQGLDAGGRPMAITPEWIPADSDMVVVSPRQGNEVKITVQRAGQTSLNVTSHGVSKTLSIKATYRASTIQAEISQ